MPSARSALAALLCGSLAFGPIAASAAVAAPVAAAPQGRLDENAKVNLLLSRFTFGPTPADEAEVRRWGIDRWFERQLQPSTIDDSALEARLDAYPAMRMTLEQRLQRYPEPQTIRQYAKTGVLPSDPELRAIVADQVEFYQMVQANKAAKAPSGPQMVNASVGGAAAPMSTGTTSMDVVTRAGQPAYVRQMPAPVVRQAPGTSVAGMGNAGPSASLRSAQDDKVGNGMTAAQGGMQPMQAGSPMMAAAAADAAPVNLEQTVQPMALPQVQAIFAMTPNERYGRLLSMPPAELIALRKAVRGPVMEAKLVDGLTPLQKETLLALQGTNRMINVETQNTRLLRDIYSQRQVEAVMTDFWLNHFNVFVGANGQIPSLLSDYEKTIRAHALGKFEDLLVATAQSPAMLLYLNNATSMGPDSPAAQRARKNPKNQQELGLNENYARELMELHTLGVNGGYTQHDVTEVAKVFTGWTLDRPNDGGDYNFNINRHQPGPKTVLGKVIQPSGESEGYEVLHMLATSPATAHFISTEIAQRFVSDAPPKAMVDRMATAYLKSDGDVKQVLLAMVHSPEFFSPATVNAKLKTPLEYVTSAVRASGADVTNPQPLVQSLQQLGMPLYGCQPPTGYKWDEATWLSSSALVNRMNFALTLSTNRVAGTNVDWTPVLTGAEPVKMLPVSLSSTSGAVGPDALRKESLLESKLFEFPVSAQTRTAVISQGTDATAQQAAAQFASGGQRVLTDAEKQAMQQDRLDAMMAGRVKGPAPVKGAAVPNARAIGNVAPVAGPPPADKQAAAMAGLLLGSPEFQRR